MTTLFWKVKISNQKPTVLIEQVMEVKGQTKHKSRQKSRAENNEKIFKNIANQWSRKLILWILQYKWQTINSTGREREREGGKELEKVYAQIRRLTQSWWHILMIPAFKKLRQQSHEFEASLGYTEFKSNLRYAVRTCLKK